MYQRLADSLGVVLSRSRRDEIERYSGLVSESWRNTKEFGRGFLTGESQTLAGLSGSITADMTLIGDVRDFSIEGAKLANNQPYDSVILGMSTIGIGLSATQLLSLGATTPLKLSASIIKVAKKMDYLSKPFIQRLSSQLSKAIDFDRLQKVDISTPSAIKKETTSVAKSVNHTSIATTFQNIDTIKSNTSIADTLFLLKYVDKPSDLQKIATMSQKYQKNTKALFRVLGKKAIGVLVKGGARVIKWTKLLVGQSLSLGIFLFFMILFIRKVVSSSVERLVDSLF